MIFPLLAALPLLPWNDPDRIGEFLRGPVSPWQVDSADPFIQASAAGAGAESTAKFRNRFTTDSGSFVIQLESNRPVAIVESGKTITIDDSQITATYRPERRSAELDLLAALPTLPPLLLADSAEFQKRIRTLVSSIPPDSKLQLRWIRPVIGMATLRASSAVPSPESEILRFSQVWLRPEFGMRLKATWQTPFGSFGQESLVYARDPVRLYANPKGFSFRTEANDLNLLLEQEGSSWILNKELTDYPRGFNQTSLFALTGKVGDAVVWAGETSRIRPVRVGDPIPGTEPIPISFPANSTSVTIRLSVDGQSINRTVEVNDGEARMVIPTGKNRQIQSILINQSEISPAVVITALVPADFA